MRKINAGMACMAFLAVIAAAPAWANTPSKTESFTGKVMCKSGIKKAVFKDALTENLTYYSLSDLDKQEQELTWPSSSNAMSFDDRQKRKTELQKALKAVRKFDCDASDALPPTESDTQPQGQGHGMKNPSQKPASQPVAPGRGF
jgi:hypothetical protein